MISLIKSITSKNVYFCYSFIHFCQSGTCQITRECIWMSSVYLLIPLPCWWWCDFWWIWPSGVPPHRWHTGTPRSSHRTPPLQCCHCSSCRSEEGSKKKKNHIQIADELVSGMLHYLGRQGYKRKFAAVLPSQGRCVLTWADLSTVLLGASTESMIKTFSVTSSSIHSCLHTGQRITFTARKTQSGALFCVGFDRDETKRVSKNNDGYCTWLHLRPILTHVVSHRRPGSLSAQPRPNSLKARANTSCRRSADMEEVWAPDCRSSGSKRDTSSGFVARLRRTFSLGFAGSQLRSLKRQRQQPPLSPAVLRKHPYAALLDVAVQGAPAQVSAPKRKTVSSVFTATLLPRLRRRQSCLFWQKIL